MVVCPILANIGSGSKPFGTAEPHHAAAVAKIAVLEIVSDGQVRHDPIRGRNLPVAAW